MPPDNDLQPAPTLGSDFPYSSLAQPTVIGPYHILSLLGEGGMGVVYQAEQRSPVRRTVALKLIKVGMDTREVIARFESERRALAMMNHPNIARVFDAGVTDVGRPYFVMEYVPGVPITEFCDKQRLPIHQRLELFIQACDAVQHAHQKALIHRDIKPGNILVALDDAKPLVKVIDFGVAKALSQRLTEKTLFTGTGRLIGTPEYMSPEQADMSALDVDTRSDIYSLGVTLYELLTGTLPFDPKSLRSAGYGEIQRIIRDVDPPRPSARFDSLGAQADSVAQQRQTLVESLSRQLRSELEWIPLMAMRKDRSQRYGTVAELVEDIRNYLQHRPLIAGPESSVYRLRKFVRRNSLLVGAVAAVLLSLTVGIIGTTAGFIRAERQRNEAVAANQSVRAVNEFLTKNVIGAADPAITRGRELTVRQALDNAASFIGQKFEKQPLIEATVRNSVSMAYRSLGRPDEALPHARRALETRRLLLGEDHPDTLASVDEVAVLLQAQGKWDEAEPLYRHTWERARRVLGEDDPLTLDVLANLGGLLQQQGKFTEAEPLQRDALAGHRRVRGNDHPDTLISINNLGFLLYLMGRFSEAETLTREALEGRRRVLEEDHPHTLSSASNLGVLLQAQGKSVEAEPYYRESLQRRRRVLGDDHPDTLASINNMGFLLYSQDRLGESEQLFSEALRLQRRLLGDDHPSTLICMNNLAGVLQSLKKLPESEALMREALDRRRRVLGENHQDTLASISNLINLLSEQRRFADAEPLAEELYWRVAEVELPPRHAAIFVARYGVCLVKLGKYVQAEKPLRDAYERLRQTQQVKSAAMRDVITALAEVCRHTARPEEAEKWRAQLEATTLPATGRSNK